MLLGVWVPLELTEPLGWQCNYLLQQWKLLQPGTNFSLNGYRENSTQLCHPKWRGFSQTITFQVVMHVRFSVSQFTKGSPRKNSNCLQTKQHPLWVHVSFFTHFNHPLHKDTAYKRDSSFPSLSCKCCFQGWARRREASVIVPRYLLWSLISSHSF